MKKLTLALLLILATAAAQAQAPRIIKKADAAILADMAAKPGDGQAATRQGEFTSNVTTTRPEGDLIDVAACTRSGAVNGVPYADAKSEIVYDYNKGTMYIKNPVHNLDELCASIGITGPSDIWVEGWIDYNLLRIPTSTVIYEDDKITLSLTCQREIDGTSYIGSDVCYLIDTYDLSLVNGQNVAIIIEYKDTDDYISILCEEGATTYALDGIIKMPEGIQTRDYVMTYDDDKGYGQYPQWTQRVGIDGNDIYIQGISLYCPQSCIKGTFDGEKAVFSTTTDGKINPVGQYNGYFLNFYAAEKTGDKSYDTIDKLEMEYDKASGTFTVKDAILTAIIGGYVEAYDQAKLTPIPDGSAPAVPAAPLSVYYHNYDDVNCIIANIPQLVDKDGNLINPDKLKYKIYADGKPYTFTPESYPLVEEATDELPAAFSNGYNITSYDALFDIYSIKNCAIYLPAGERYGSIGVQAVYYGGGERNTSDIVYAEVLTSISNVDAGNHGEPVKTEYFTLAGVKVSKPTNGVYIKVETFADGTSKSVKIMHNS